MASALLAVPFFAGFGRLALWRNLAWRVTIALRHRGVGVSDSQALPGDVGADQRGVYVHHLAARDPGGHTRLHDPDKHSAETVSSPPLADAGEARMIRQHVGQAEPREPADRNVDLGFAHQPTVMDNTKQEPGQHEPQCNLGINAGPSGTIHGVTLPHLRPEPAQVEHLVHPSEHMAVGNEVSK